MEIKIRYQSVDRFRESRKFKSLAGARRYAQKMVGKFPEMGFAYAVSQDGIGTLHAEGCRLEDLFGNDKPKTCQVCKGSGIFEKLVAIECQGELLDYEPVSAFCDCAAGQAAKEKHEREFQEAEAARMKFNPNDPNIPF